jgi:D-glycero-D-manno-heptose 1,7-bisphosphate phosphatase
MFPAVFLDRDGVIIENVDTYVRSWAEVVFLPSALAALQKLGGSPYKIVLVTNQSAVGRGLISLSEARQISQRIVAVITDAGGRVDGVFMCPHAPQEACTCRKPLPGLILQAAEALSIDLSRSVMIGDALSDIQAGQAAGIHCCILVRTGRGAAQLHLPQAASLPPFQVSRDLESALDLLPGGG